MITKNLQKTMSVMKITNLRRTTATSLSDHSEDTRSCRISEAKQGQFCSVFGWANTKQDQVPEPQPEQILYKPWKMEDQRKITCKEGLKIRVRSNACKQGVQARVQAGGASRR